MEQLKLRIMRVSHEAFAKPLADGAKALVRMQQQLADMVGVGGRGPGLHPGPDPSPDPNLTYRNPPPHPNQVRELLQQIAESRLSAKQVLVHHWLTSHSI